MVDKPYAHYLRRLARAELQIVDITSDRLTGFSGLEDEKIGFAVRREDKDLLRRLNRAIVENPQLLREFQEQVLPAPQDAW